MLAREAANFERERFGGVGVEVAAELERPRANHLVWGGFFSLIFTQRGFVAAFSAL